MTAKLLASDRDAIRILTLNRPACLNALDRELRDALVDQLQAAADDPAVGAVVVTGAGERAFCAGQDLNESENVGESDSGDWLGSWQRLFEAFLTHPKPLVAAVNGVAAGGGLEIVMFCDIRIAVPDARLIMAEIDVGLPTLIGSYTLSAHVFDSRMTDFVLSGRTIGCDEARHIGLVHHVAEAADLQRRYLAVAGELASKPRRAMALNIKRFRELRMSEIERDGVFTALQSYQKEAMASGEPQRVMASFLAERARRREGKPSTEGA